MVDTEDLAGMAGLAATSMSMYIDRMYKKEKIISKHLHQLIVLEKRMNEQNLDDLEARLYIALTEYCRAEVQHLWAYEIYYKEEMPNIIIYEAY